MLPQARIALYYAPAATDPLHAAASTWLGRDAEANAPLPSPIAPDYTAEPRLYGFHATLKPPMRLREGTTWSDVLKTAEQIATSVPVFALPKLKVTNLGGFLALTEAEKSVPLQALADACIAGADHLRAPATEAELARRRKGGALPPAMEANLTRWGYHYAFATWQFHMTLTRRLTPEERAEILPQAESHFAHALAHPREVTDLAIFTQPHPGANFVIAERLPLTPPK
jgi:hypothetical protein